MGLGMGWEFGVGLVGGKWVWELGSGIESLLGGWECRGVVLRIGNGNGGWELGVGTQGRNWE